MIQIVGTQLSQWDVGRSVNITDSDATHIHFANQGDSKAVIMEIENGMAKVPDYLLRTGKTVIAYAVKDGITLESKSFSVRKRERPENYIYEDDQRNYIYELIKNAEDATYEARMAAEGADSAAGNAGAAAGVAYDAAQKANLATNNANTATDKANLAAKNANEAVTKANNAVKNMMVVGEAKGESFALSNAIDQTLVGLRVFGKTTQDGTPTPDVPVELDSVGDSGSVAVMVSGKNILENKATVTAMNGVECTVNADGSITLNGTANADILITINRAVYGIVPGKSYTISGCPNVNGTRNLYFAQHNDAGAIANTNTYDVGSGATAKILPECKYLWVGFYAASGTVFSGDTIYPMVRLASVTDATYEPYKAQNLTISTPNGLPGIPVASGGNYTDTNGQQWICDEKDFSRGMYVQRVIRASDLPWRIADNDGYPVGNSLMFRSSLAEVLGNTQIRHRAALCNMLPYANNALNNDVNGFYFSFGTIYARIAGVADLDTFIGLMDGAEIITFLDNHTETPLSAEELAAYAALHTYKDSTTVSNDAGAYMSLEYVMDAKKYIDSLVGTGGTILPARVE